MSAGLRYLRRRKRGVRQRIEGVFADFLLFDRATRITKASGVLEKPIQKRIFVRPDLST